MATDSVKSQDRATTLVVVAIFIALVLDGMCMQMISLALPVLMTDFNISKVLAGSIGTYVLIGMGVGGLIAGWLSDRIGRVKVTFYSIIMFSLMNITLVFSQSYLQFAFLSFFTGLGIAAVYSIGTLMVAEYVPTNKRTTILGTLQAGWSVGYIIAAISSSYILPNWGWRPLFLIPLIPSLVTLWLLKGLKEPPSYSAFKSSGDGPKGSIWGELLGNKNTRTIFILWSFTLLALQFGYYGVTTWLPSYLVKDLGINLKSMGLYIAGTYSAMFFGKILTGWLSDKYGRRVIWVVTGMVTAVALPLVMKYVTVTSVTYLFPIFGFFYGAPFAILATYLSESFPTRVRGTAVASANALGRVGSMLSPIFIGLVAEKYSIAYGIAFLGIAYALASLLPGIFIREKMYDPKAING